MSQEKRQVWCDIQTGVCGDEDFAIERKQGSRHTQQVKIHYYTDPICSACWAIEPELKRLKYEYGAYFQMTTYMGGLLKGWEQFKDSANGIMKPEHVASHWEEVAIHFQMPIDGDVWVEDPLATSYPPSIAYKAAQKQEDRLAEHLLRRLREMVFLEKKNIAKDPVIFEAVEQVGLDLERFKEDYDDVNTKNEFIREMKKCRRLGVRGFPTFIFSGMAEQDMMLTGIRPYETYVQVLKDVYGEDVLPKPLPKTAEEAFSDYSSLTTKEVSVLTAKSFHIAKQELEQLEKRGFCKQVMIKNGELWVKK